MMKDTSDSTFVGVDRETAPATVEENFFKLTLEAKMAWG